jgi:Zn-dependent protease
MKTLLFPLLWFVNDTQLGKPFGIPLIVTSYFKIFVLSFAIPSFFLTGCLGALAMIAAILIAYSCVVFHEYSHALTAKYYGYQTTSISIWPFAGLASIDMNAVKAKEEFWITVNGPLMNLGIALFLFPIVYCWPNEILIAIMQLNCLLVGFNMLPIYPMDGGRIFRSFLGMNFCHQEKAAQITRWTTLTGAIMLSPVLWIYFNPIASILIGVMGILCFFEKPRADIDLVNNLVNNKEILKQIKEVVKHYDEEEQEQVENALMSWLHWLAELQDQIIKILLKKKLSVEQMESQHKLLMERLAVFFESEDLIQFSPYFQESGETRKRRINAFADMIVHFPCEMWPQFFLKEMSNV